MAIQYPADRQEVFDRVATDMLAVLPESNPFLRNSFIKALAIGYSGGIFDAYKIIQQLEKQCFVDTSTGEYLARWGSLKNIYILPATQSSGYITITGNVGITIPANTQLQLSNGKQFLTQNECQTTAQTINVLSMTRSGGLVTVTTVNNHHFATGNIVTISGANESDYNGSVQIVVTALDTFTFSISATPATPATGTIKVSMNFVSVLVKSVDFGVSTNADSGSELFFDTRISGIDNTAIVQFDAITGGNDQENDVNYLKRVLYAYQNPVSFFNVSEITLKCLEVNGVTRVFVQETTPDVGQVTVFFMRDNDTNPIPSGSQVAAVKDKLLTIKPAHMSPDDVFVYAPTPKIINFKFSVLEPNTETMRAAILESLKAFFSEVPVVGQNLTKNSYPSAIYNTVDITTGQYVTNFVLAYPLGDILVNNNQIAILGTVTF